MWIERFLCLLGIHKFISEGIVEKCYGEQDGSYLGDKMHEKCLSCGKERAQFYPDYSKPYKKSRTFKNTVKHQKYQRGRIRSKLKEVNCLTKEGLNEFLDEFLPPWPDSPKNKPLTILSFLAIKFPGTEEYSKYHNRLEYIEIISSSGSWYKFSNFKAELLNKKLELGTFFQALMVNAVQEDRELSDDSYQLLELLHKRLEMNEYHKNVLARLKKMTQTEKTKRVLALFE